MNGGIQPWGRAATFGLGLLALVGGQFAALAALTWWYGSDIAKMPDFTGDGVAIAVVILVSNPVQFAFLALWSRLRGADVRDYLGLTLPRRSDLIVGIAAVIALVVLGDLLSALLGRDVITTFQSDIYRSAAEAGALPLLWLAVVVVAPIGEETLFRGFLFRGWLRGPRDVWPVIVITSLLWSLIHVQYDWYVIGQVFVSGLLLGWMRWATGSTILTIVLHGLINIEGMLESVMAYHG